MFKKLACLLLCLALLVPVLASCSKSDNLTDDILDEASRYTTTLNLWMITEDETDPEQAAAVNAAINKITKAKFKTQVNIKYLHEDEYYGALEAAFEAKAKADEEERAAKKAALEAQKEAAKRGETITTTAEEVTKEETFLNEYGIPELKYPEAPDYQVDILFIGSYEKYREYADRELLASMDDVMADSASQLAYYINSLFQEAAVYDGLTYAMPNNHGIGEYTFLVADGALMEEYGYTSEDFANSSIYDKNCHKFLQYAFNDGITPIYSESGTVDLSLVHYWNFDLDSVEGVAIQRPDVFSLYGSIFSNQAQRGDLLNNGLILNNTEYVTRWKYKTEYETTAGFITTDPEERTAVRVVKGGYELKEQYEKAGYIVMTTESPRATDETVYNSMFAIGASSSDPARAMEIIAYINTNPELRNLLQYGVENVNYVLNTFTDEDGTEYQYVTPTETNRYFMDIAKTGNQFIAYPDSKESVYEWDYQKKQNLDATTYPTLGLYFDPSMTLNTNAVRIINAVSAKVSAYMEANLTTTANVDAFFAAVSTAARTTADMAAYLVSIIGEDVVYNASGDKVTVENLIAAMNVMRVATINESKDATQSPYALYCNWRETSGVAAKNNSSTQKPAS